MNLSLRTSAVVHSSNWVDTGIKTYETVLSRVSLEKDEKKAHSDLPKGKNKTVHEYLRL